MTPELQKYYDDQFSMFSTEGWKELMVTVDGMLLATDKVSGVKDEKELFFKKGEISILYWIKGWEEAVTTAYEDLKNEP